MNILDIAMLGKKILPLLLFTVPLSLLGVGYYLQYTLGLSPCPLCIIQRACYFLLGLLGLALLFKPHRGLYLCTLIISGMGLYTAGRQVWLQHLPADKVPECGPGLAYMIDTFPPSEVLTELLTGAGECAEVTWSLLGLSLAEWSLMAFTGFTVIAIMGLRKKIKAA